MMNKQYKPKDIEQQIYSKWEENNCFSPKESASKFSIVLPPPNVTGTLHMGMHFNTPSSMYLFVIIECSEKVCCGNQEQIMQE